MRISFAEKIVISAPGVADVCVDWYDAEETEYALLIERALASSSFARAADPRSPWPEDDDE
jgi:hypothetical protein